VSPLHGSDGPRPLDRRDMVFGRALAMLRITRGMSQTEAARLLGTSNTRLSKWENGESATFGSVHDLLRDLGFSWSSLERARQLVREQRKDRGQGPRPLQRALPPDLAELSELIGKTVAYWYLQSVQRELSSASDRPDRPARLKHPARRGGIRHRRPSDPPRGSTRT
jgi:transcriptional regulator with XRE-family HTH domain